MEFEDTMGVDAVLFDLDDTLHDRSAAFCRWATEFVETRLRMPGTGERQSAVEWLIAADENGYCSRPEFAARVKARFPDIVSEPVEEFVLSFQLGLVSKIELAEGAELLLDALSARSVPWGIVTNGTTRQQTRKIARLGLADRAACVLISEAFGAKKPHAEIFLAAAQKIGAEPGSILFVGDHPVNDILGAQAAGMRTAWLRLGRDWPREHADTRPDLILEGLAELDAGCSKFSTTISG
jgi:HAD superfamily hydrolase (TIGR01509 family)